MKGMNGGGPGTGKFGRGTSEDSGLGRVGVDDVRPEYADLIDELGQSSDVVPRFDCSPEAFNAGGFNVGGLGFQIVSLVVGAVAGVQVVVEFIIRECAHQSRDLNSWSAYVHAGDDAHDA